MFSNVRAERVGYSFTGYLNLPKDAPKTWFGEILANTAKPMTGTFSYDTDDPGTLSDEGHTRTYTQKISGGYSLDVCFGTKHVVVHANEYKVSVVNNFASDDDPNTPPTDSFVVNYMYWAAVHLEPKRLRVNGTEWMGDANITLGMFWDESAFPASDEPKLTVDRLENAPDSMRANANSTFTGAGPPSITVDQNLFTRISPQPGDYNVDGKVDTWDYLEWRNAYGNTGERYKYADGNNDGVIDGGDYLVWRMASGSGLGLASIPEAGGLAPMLSGVSVLLGSGKRWQRAGRQL